MGQQPGVYDRGLDGTVCSRGRDDGEMVVLSADEIQVRQLHGYDYATEFSPVRLALFGGGVGPDATT